MPASPTASLPEPDPSATAPDRCTLQHPVFRRYREAVFRPAEDDGAPVMVIPMSGAAAAMPLSALRAEFGIDSDSPDGRMLAQIARALDFIPELRLGDPLPMEVLGSGASWHPSAKHQRVAEERLRLQLGATLADGALGPGPAWVLADPQAVLAAAAEPGAIVRLQSASVAAAAVLALPNAAAVARLLAAAAHELGFIEALRDRLLRRVGVVLARAEGLVVAIGRNLGALELLSRVRRLAGIAHERIRARFTEVEVLSAQVLDLLRDFEIRRLTIQLHRDWLYSSLRGWEDILLAWETATAGWSQETWVLLRRTYRFLALRFMPVQKWQLSTRPHRADAATRVPMVW